METGVGVGAAREAVARAAAARAATARAGVEREARALMARARGRVSRRTCFGTKPTPPPGR